jgi:hypothetical protein
LLFETCRSIRVKAILLPASVQQSTKLELILNLKAATALGLSVPILVLARADAVIEWPRVAWPAFFLT